VNVPKGFREYYALIVKMVFLEIMIISATIAQVKLSMQLDY